jgi:hypothetical protein
MSNKKKFQKNVFLRNDLKMLKQSIFLFLTRTKDLNFKRMCFDNRVHDY